MGKTIGGILLAALALWLWGFLFWGLNPMPYETWSATKDDAAAQAALREHFPEGGTYFIPSRAHPLEQQQALLEAGPWGFVEISYAKRAPFEMSTMVYGLGVNLVFAAVLALLMYRVRNTARTYSGRLGVPLWLAVASVVLFEGGDVVWWGLAADWQLQQAIYHFVGVFLTGAVLAYFIKGEARERLV